MRRRAFLGTSGGALAGLWGASRADWSNAARHAADTAIDAPYEFLTTEQATLVDVVTAHLVPTDETPGAREAHVVRFIDHALATFMKDQQKSFAGHLAALEKFAMARGKGRVPFLQRSPADQVAILTAFEKKQQTHFGPIRDMTMLGMFSNPVHGGNFSKIGWQLIGYEDRYSWVPPFGYYDR